MNFYQGGLYPQYRDEGCFVKYMADAIQSTQFHLKNEQWDINVDFEEFVSSIRRFGEPLCIWNWHNMRRNEKSDLSGYVRDEGMLVRNFDMTHFIYLFDNGKWRYFDTFGTSEWHKLNVWMEMNKQADYERIGPYVEENHCSVQPSCFGKTLHTAPAGVLLSTGITI